MSIYKLLLGTILLANVNFAHPLNRVGSRLVCDSAIFTILADEVTFGGLSISYRASGVPGFKSGYIDLKVEGEPVKRIQFENVPEGELLECENRRCSVFYLNIKNEYLLVQSPRAALSKAKVSPVDFGKVKSKLSEAAISLVKTSHCTKKMVDLLDQLSSDQQQAAIDSLFTETRSLDDYLCLASQID